MDKWVSWRRHRVKPGETLSSIAKKYRVTPAAIADANGLERGAALNPGEKLVIPAAQTGGKRPRAGWCATGCARAIPWEVSPTSSAWDQRGPAQMEWAESAQGGDRGMVLRVYTVGGAPEAKSAQARTAPKKKTHADTRVAQSTTSSPNKN